MSVIIDSISVDGFCYALSEDCRIVLNGRSRMQRNFSALCIAVKRNLYRTQYAVFASCGLNMDVTWCLF